MRYSFELYGNVGLNALSIAIAEAAILNHFVSWVEVGLLLVGVLLQLLLTLNKPKVVNWLEQHSIVGRLVLLGSVTMVVLATSPQRSVQNLCLLTGIYSLGSFLLSLYSKLFYKKHKQEI